MDTIKICSDNVKMIAHRGLSGLERENTAPAFVAAGNRSYFGVETDVHKAGDGKFVILHDDTTERVSMGNCNINVEESDWEQISQVVLPDLDGNTSRQDIRIPLLADYILICKKYEKKCVLELKRPLCAEDIKRMVEEIAALGYLEHVIFISFVLENCTVLRSLLPKNEIQWLTFEELSEEMLETLLKENLDLDIYYELVTKELVDRLHAKGIKVNCWTCDKKEEAEKLVKMGVDFITTNILE